MPFFDQRSIILAFDDGKPVGYVHTTLGPSEDESQLDTKTGQICFLCVDLSCHDLYGVARALLKAAEDYLFGIGVERIYGGSPRPCAPFYIGFYGGAEAIGFFESDQHILRVFQEANYQVFSKTSRFHLNLNHYSPPVTPGTIGWRSQLYIEYDPLPKSETWWEALSWANFEWVEVTAFHNQDKQAIAQALFRITKPDPDEKNKPYSDGDVGLMDIRVHYEFCRQGVAAFTLNEALRHIMARNKVTQIEAHTSDDIVMALLRSLQWNEIDTGVIFVKDI